MNAASLQAAWLMFRDASKAPPSAKPHFKAALIAAMTDPRPYTHGDPRVDRWQTATGGHHPPDAEQANNHVGIPQGFEPLAAWSPFALDGGATIWERPLRRVAKEPDR